MRSGPVTVMEDTCIFVSSSDNTFDVFSLVSPSVVRHWRKRGLTFFVGLNAQMAPAPFVTVSAPVSGWRTELAHQIDALPEGCRYVILILDDFFFSASVDEAELRRLVAIARQNNMDYLRLKPVERSCVGRLLLMATGDTLAHGSVRRLAANEPYYSSLQVAIWKREYLSRLLCMPGSIWEFEHLVEADSKHYAVVRPVVAYRHLVEKGKWLRDAPKVLGLSKTDELSGRGFDQSRIGQSKVYNRIKFFLFGYWFFRIRRAGLASGRPFTVRRP